MRIVAILIGLALMVGCPAMSHAATYYVRAGASGLNNGSDWQHAFTRLPTALARGAVYLVAGGSYGDYVFDDPTNGTDVIEVRKATPDAHGTDVGWDPSYGEAVAYWGAVSFRTSYYVFNGVTGHGRDAAPYGFQQNFTGRSSPVKAFDVDGSHIVITHVKSSWDNRDDTGEVQSRWLDATTGSPRDITVSYAYVRELPGLPFYFIGSGNILVEYFVLEGMHSDPTWHAEIASNRSVTDLTVRYSWFMDGNGTGGWMSMEGTNTNWRIYGNVFLQTDRAHANPGFGHGIFADNMQAGSSTTGVFYNNTVANYTSTLRSGLAFWAGTSIESRNNIARNSKGFTNIGVTLGSHNYLSGSPATSEFTTSRESFLQVDANDPFVNSSRVADAKLTDWQLSGRNVPAAGHALPAPYNESCIHRLWLGPTAACVVRGADGHWDRGAIEYVGAGSVPPAPSDLQVR